ncbi:sucrose phosphorylase [Vibrio variabilis]|uniref:Sucrose phosphorylase n=1 Tax=Vibrio variabilis TaxID=990271 RepID=A0ABQ0J6W8_9VIBR|nr:sucrose phosphorylase [Vibrio variabilis]
MPFQENPSTGDCRVCGSLASLAGLEKAIELDDAEQIEHALKRVRLLNSIVLSIGGVPLIYQGDELGILNDHSYLSDEFKRDDSRWVNRPAITDDAMARALEGDGYQNRIHNDLKQMIALRQADTVFGAAQTGILETYRLICSLTCVNMTMVTGYWLFVTLVSTTNPYRYRSVTAR